ncbi:MAG: nitronate monooxygenase [Proteobacteria bacterium]|nr:nitronate monooxygenase [Pseudomonadota bacterium]
MKTRITELLGIKYPIIEAPMAWITDAVLAAAVSEAGGLGTIGPNAGSKTVTSEVGETGERLRGQIRKFRELSGGPFAVNFVVGVVGWDRKYSDHCLEVGIEERVPVAVVSQGSPIVYTQRMKDAGMKVIHVCSTVRHVQKAEQAGADAVVVSGTEGGGHSGFDQLTTFCLVPQAASAVEIPVIAGGGVVDARGLMGALSLGAEAVYMGTRFMATQECPTHPNVKQAVLQAIDTSTMAVRHGSPFAKEQKSAESRGFVEERRGSVRMLINEALRKVIVDKGGAISFADALEAGDSSEANPESNRTVNAFVQGDLEHNSITMSQGSALITDVPTCRALIERIVEEAESILGRLNSINQ